MECWWETAEEAADTQEFLDYGSHSETENFWKFGSELYDAIVEQANKKRAVTPDQRDFAIGAHHCRCFYCGRVGTLAEDHDGGAWHIDHLWPWSQGGLNGWWNFVLACGSCNIRKRAQNHFRFLLDDRLARTNHAHDEERKRYQNGHYAIVWLSDHLPELHSLAETYLEWVFLSAHGETVDCATYIVTKTGAQAQRISRYKKHDSSPKIILPLPTHTESICPVDVENWLHLAKNGGDADAYQWQVNGPYRGEPLPDDALSRQKCFVEDVENLLDPSSVA